MAKVRKHNGAWVADYCDQWGKRHRERPEGKFANMTRQKQAAAKLLSKRLGEVDRGSYSAESKLLSFETVADRYLESKINIRLTTRRSYKGLIELYLKPYFGQWKIQTINAADVEAFRNSLVDGYPLPIEEAFIRNIRNARPGLSEARAKQRIAKKKPGIRTVNKCLTLLVMIFNYSCRHRWTDFNPCEHVEKLKAPLSMDSNLIDGNVLGPSEVAKLIDCASAGRRNKHGHLISNNYQLLIKTAVFTGLRSGEIRGLQWGDIDWNRRQLFVRRSWREGHYSAPKTQASLRRVEIPRMLVSELKAWKLECPQSDDELVFPNQEGRPLSNANLLQRGFYPALRKAGIRKIRFHDLRHTFASLLIANGADVVRVSRLLGHASPAITLKVYSHMLPQSHYGCSDGLVQSIYGAPSSSHDSQLNV